MNSKQKVTLALIEAAAEALNPDIMAIEDAKVLLEVAATLQFDSGELFNGAWCTLHDEEAAEG